MNADSRSTDPSDLDRMVDGELTEEEQKSLLLEIEQQPDGWKRLALAYVEDQAWRSHFRNEQAGHDKENSGRQDGSSQRAALDATVTTLTVRPEDSVVLNADDHWPARRFRLQPETVVAVLLALLVGFLSGGTVGDRPSEKDSSTDGVIADGQDRTGDGFPDLAQPGANAPAENQGVIPVEQHQSDSERSTPVPSEFVQLAVSDGRSDRPRMLDVPIRNVSEEGDSIFDESASVIPPDVREFFRQAGHEVHEDRRYWPVELPDGRQVLVPVNNVRLQYVGGRIHQ